MCLYGPVADGCAQYLSSPSAPYLIAQAYREAGQPPPVLIACVRNPADQALSWWDYEKNGMSFTFISYCNVIA
jgi:hypothetical protein